MLRASLAAAPVSLSTSADLKLARKQRDGSYGYENWATTLHKRSLNILAVIEKRRRAHLACAAECPSDL